MAVVDASTVGAAVVGELLVDKPVVNSAVVDGTLVREDVEIVEDSGDAVSSCIRFLAVVCEHTPELVVDTANSRNTVKATQYSAQKILLAEGDAYGADWKMVMVRHTLLGAKRK